MNVKEIRKAFIDFFKNHKHYNVEPAPLVNKNDPTLMFTNAGMNQFKNYFLGDATPKHKTIVDSQPCLRVSGKHNDLEDVGIDTYHHTLFEMLGNWSFGDYFKEGAIKFAWELLTNIYKIPNDKIYITIFEGDKRDNLKPDLESLEIWKNYISEERIIYCSKKDNFWEMGETGPCGPCSEIHVDIRSKEEKEKLDGKKLVNKDHPQVIEIWNLVFIQYNRLSSGKLENLPEKHVDTGMGLERLAMVLQNKKSNYDTDVFSDLINKICAEANIKYGQNQKVDIAIRVIADHSRAITLAIAEGLLPSNNQAGYVIRRILRRAVRYGYSFLKFEKPFLFKLVPIIAKQFEDLLPEIIKQELYISKVIKEEELSFINTLSQGIKRLNHAIKNTKNNIIDGTKVFELYDTYGFPPDLTAVIAKENNLDIDITGFEASMNKQKLKSKTDAQNEQEDWVILNNKETKFVGYDSLESKSKIIKYQKVKEKNKSYYKIVLDITPFYPEGGGQVGDTGYLEFGNKKIDVFNTKKENDVIIHYADNIPENPNIEIFCKVNEEKRILTSNNHTATHLMHAALIEVLGKHVSQKGSLVNDKLLRFDFSHFAKLTNEEIEKIETIVNEKIRQNISLEEKKDIEKEKAIIMGAKALFGEKYGDKVRVIIFDKNFSIELCGGTHAKSTSNLGIFKIISENSVASGVRRIEAVTSKGAQEYINKKISIINAIEILTKHPKDIVKNIEQLIEEKNNVKKELDNITLQQLKSIKLELKQKIQKKENHNFLIAKIKTYNSESLKKLCFELKNEYNPIIIILAAEIKQKAQIAVMISDNLVEKHDLDARKIINKLSKLINGGGGGQEFFAVAGGSNLKGLDDVTIQSEQYMKELSI
ncbi:MAG: alanine--tRNA ligase [Bacteroidetes bacterium]|nr:alanine--tRNA ligase [Bacteroidota bacterium]